MNLDPRLALDVTSQAFNSVLFRSLTRLSPDLQPEPDLAESWKSTPDGLHWEFQIRNNLQDHGGEPIGAPEIAACLESYRTDQKRSSSIRSFTESWIAVKPAGNRVRIDLKTPDPFLPGELPVLKYFRVAGQKSPCSGPEAADQPLIASGPYRPESWKAPSEGNLKLIPVSPRLPTLTFSFVQDENTKLLKLVRGDIDAALNVFSGSKLGWLQFRHRDEFTILERTSSSVSYLAFNLNHPILSKSKVRQAIAHAIDRKSIAEMKIHGQATDSLIPAWFPEGRITRSGPSFDPELSRRLLDEAGFPMQHGKRFRLFFKTTPFRESQELATIFQRMLSAVGIELVIESVESAVFFASIRKGNFELFTSRWVGVTNGTVLNRALHSQSPANRTGYHNPRVDSLLSQALREPEELHRNELFRSVQEILLDDLPVLPLWSWNNTLVLKKGVTGLKSEDLYRSNSIEALSRLTYTKENRQK